MTQALITVDAAPMALAEWQRERLDLLKSTIAKDLTDNELALFVEVCKLRNLDPFLKQIYAVKRKSKGYNGQPDTYVMTIQTGIDGFRLIADRTGRYAPGKAPEYQYDDKGNLSAATSFVRKMTPDGTWHEVSAVALWSEYAQYGYGDKLSPMWAKMPHTMLAKCAEALALRKAFPADLSGLYTDDEMAQADTAQIVVDARPAPAETSKPAQFAQPVSDNAAAIGRLKALWAMANNLWGVVAVAPASWKGKKPAEIDAGEIETQIGAARAEMIVRIDAYVNGPINQAESKGTASNDDVGSALEWSNITEYDSISDSDLWAWASWATEAGTEYDAGIVRAKAPDEIPF